MSAPITTPLEALGRAVHERVRDEPALLDALAGQYAPDGGHCGANFLDGTETAQPRQVTAVDLFAVTQLGVEIPPAAARRLLTDTPESERIARCLAAVPVDAPLEEADSLLLGAMRALHDAVVAAFADDSGSGHAAASAVCARKRPESFPYLGHDFLVATGLPPATDPSRSWTLLRDLLRTTDIADRIDRVYDGVRWLAPGTPLDIHPLRRLYVLMTVGLG